MSTDLIRESAEAGRIVINEESPRDGAQGKTMMSADFRVRLAKEQGAIFGADGPRHVVFAAGFPSVGPQEFEATRRVALEAHESVSPAAVCRGIEADVRLGLDAVRGVPNGRILVVIPSSDHMADVMQHRDVRDALNVGLELVRRAADLAGGETFIDVGLADAPRGDPAMIGEFSAAMTEAGASTINLGDSIGDLLPEETTALYTETMRHAGPDTVFASHLHNDLGLGLANTLAAIDCGVRIVASSWLGIAERSGLSATEQLLFILAYRPDRTEKLLGPGAEPWWTKPDLMRLPRIAKLVSEETGVPLIVTTPIVGTGVGSISTGTPFVRPEVFQPYPPEILGLKHDVLLTHLASNRVVSHVARSLGHDLTPAESSTAMSWVKDRAYRTNRAVIPPDEFTDYLDGMAAAKALAAAQQVTAGPGRVFNLGAACRALTDGKPVIVPNPSPMTYGIVSTVAPTVNALKERPLEQNVAVSVHDPMEWSRIAPLIDVPPGTLERIRMMLRMRISLVVPLLPGGAYPEWLDPAVKDGRLAMFSGWWEPTSQLWEQFPRLYGSSANRTGELPASSAPEAAKLFGPEVPVVDADALRDLNAAHSASNMVLVSRTGELSLHRKGAQDAASGLGPDEYVRELSKMNVA